MCIDEIAKDLLVLRNLHNAAELGGEFRFKKQDESCMFIANAYRYRCAAIP